MKHLLWLSLFPNMFVQTIRIHRPTLNCINCLQSFRDRSLQAQKCLFIVAFLFLPNKSAEYLALLAGLLPAIIFFTIQNIASTCYYFRNKKELNDQGALHSSFSSLRAMLELRYCSLKYFNLAVHKFIIVTDFQNFPLVIKHSSYTYINAHNNEFPTNKVQYPYFYCLFTYNTPFLTNFQLLFLFL